MPAPPPSLALPEAEVAAVREAVVAWYREHARDLPWRRTRDPYAILVSELMLQQQTVRHVTPIYLRFLERFPDLASLARASRAEVIRTWQPLGRYASAVRLHTIARRLVAERAGVVPRTVEALLELGGIGRYTAGAIVCFAFGVPAPLVDTNVRRVLVRLFGPDLPAGVPAERLIWSLAEALLPEGAAYEWNQGLMDLGAGICIARAPRCAACPLTAWCDFTSRAAGAPGDSPAPAGPAGEARAGAIAETRAPYGASPRPAAGSARPGARFEGSRRWYRGQIMQTLCALPQGEAISLEALGHRVVLDEQPADGALLDDLVRALGKDGLICAETRPDGTTWLALPE